MPKVYATWNPEDKGVFIVLSNGNLTAASNTNTWNAVRATQGKSSGKWYFEVSPTLGYADLVFGFGTSAMYLGASGSHGFPGYDPSDISWGHHWSGANRWNQRNSSAQFAAVVTNAIYRVKADLDTGSIKVAIDGGAFYAADLNATSVLGETIYPAVGPYGTGHECTANFGASAFIYDVPSGYNAGWYEGGEIKGFRKLGKGLTKGLGRGL